MQRASQWKHVTFGKHPFSRGRPKWRYVLAPGLVQDMNISPENWGFEDVLSKDNIYSGATGTMWVFRWKKSHQFENATQNLKVQLFFGGHVHIFVVVETKKNCEKKIRPSIFGGFYGLHLEGWKTPIFPTNQRNTQELLSEIHALGRQLSMKTAELEVSQIAGTTFW